MDRGIAGRQSRRADRAEELSAARSHHRNDNRTAPLLAAAHDHGCVAGQGEIPAVPAHDRYNKLAT
jgi:hypothetical protein